MQLLRPHVAQGHGGRLTPTGRLLVHLIASLAEFERELIRDRVRACLTRVKATGRTRSGKAVSRPRRDVDLQAVAALCAAGPSWREIAIALKVPTRTLHRAWQNLAPVSVCVAPLGAAGCGGRSRSGDPRSR